LTRIALELIANALNFTDKGLVKLTTKLAKTTKRGTIVKLIVEDTGIGIAPDQQQEIFLQFKRLTPSYEGIYKGAGLGLSIAKKFLDEIEGEIYVESKVGFGTKFTCLIPLQTPLLDDDFGCENITPATVENPYEMATQTKAIAFLTSGEIGDFNLSNNRVLVVEDHHMAASVAKALLFNLDCQVDIAPDGKTAIQLAQEHSYGLIFMDIGLPDIDGYEVTKRIRLYELSKGIHVPIIALTAHVDEENKQNCIAVGMNAVLSKPLVKEKAEDILNSFIPYRKDKLKVEASNTPEEITPKAEALVLDLEFVEKQFGKDGAIATMTLLLESFSEDLVALQSAHKENDWLSVQDFTHKLKGGGSYCGTMRLIEACFNLESAIRAGKNELFEDFYNQLLDEIALASKAIQEKL